MNSRFREASKRIQESVSEWRWRLVNSHPLASIPWSTIRRIGQSRLLGLTIVVPFLGSLLIFNQHVVDLLTLSPDLMRRWFKVSPIAAEDVARQVTLTRLYFVYFGLSFLGVGSAFFTLFCPLAVKTYASPVAYIQNEASLVTKPRMGLMVFEIVDSYTAWLGENLHSISGMTARLGEPTNFIWLGSRVIIEIFKEVQIEDERADVEAHASAIPEEVEEVQEVELPDAPPNVDESEIDNDPFYDFRGRPDASRIAATLYFPSRMLEGFREHFIAIASSEKNRTDAMTLHYMAQDNARPWLRATVAAFYGLGFGLLLIPATLTFFQVGWHAAFGKSY